jgi:hypothetical protein
MIAAIPDYGRRFKKIPAGTHPALSPGVCRKNIAACSARAFDHLQARG